MTTSRINEQATEEDWALEALSQLHADASPSATEPWHTWPDPGTPEFWPAPEAGPQTRPEAERSAPGGAHADVRPAPARAAGERVPDGPADSAGESGPEFAAGSPAGPELWPLAERESGGVPARDAERPAFDPGPGDASDSGGSSRGAVARFDGARSEPGTECPEPDAVPPRHAGADVPERGGADGTRPVAVRRGPVDPVKGLMHRHRELCEQAVDPLEIAAGLEAHGVTDRTAARFRHRDVFSLAEELFARVPRRAEVPIRPARAADPGAGRMLLALLPGAVCALAVLGREVSHGSLRLAASAVGAVAVTVVLGLCLGRGPLRARGRTVRAVRIWTVCLLVFAAYGQGFVGQVVTGGPDERWPVAHGPFLALCLAVAPAAWCAHLFSVRARRRLDRSRTLDEFAAGVRPLLFAVVTLYTGALAVLLAFTALVLPGPVLLPTAALGVLFFLARLLVVHGFPEAAATALATACAAEAAAPALLLSGRLPGLGFLAGPVEALVAAWGPAAVPALACGAVALGLLVHATTALSRASAHTP
ncbi:hypothetical protein [Streptomyces sp. NPDC002187]|uniref:hypothetical protein n=1 Tax=Streptomyces sp. NPDC002187 TaxID=3364637 RepID=UPI003697CC2F